MSNSWECSAGSVPVENGELTFIRKMNGSAQSILVADSDERLWIVKLHNSPRCGNSLANEVIGVHLCDSVGLPSVPRATIEIADDFFEDKRTWFNTLHGLQRPSGGLHFASRCLQDLTRTMVFDFVPSTLRPFVTSEFDCLGMFIFDVWAVHTDVRQALYRKNGATLVPTFIDHGHLFGGPYWQSEKINISGHFLQKIALDASQHKQSVARWIATMQSILPLSLDHAITLVPATWYTGDVDHLRTRLNQRLGMLPLLVAQAMGILQARLEYTHLSGRRVLSPRMSPSWQRSMKTYSA